MVRDINKIVKRVTLILPEDSMIINRQDFQALLLELESNPPIIQEYAAYYIDSQKRGDPPESFSNWYTQRAK
jgi:hypothetical protein